MAHVQLATSEVEHFPHHFFEDDLMPRHEDMEEAGLGNDAYSVVEDMAYKLSY